MSWSAVGSMIEGIRPVDHLCEERKYKVSNVAAPQAGFKYGNSLRELKRLTSIGVRTPDVYLVGYGLADRSRVRLRLFIPSALYLFSGLQAAVIISLALDEAPLKISHATTGGRTSRNSISLPLKGALGPNHFAAVGC